MQWKRSHALYVWTLPSYYYFFQTWLTSKTLFYAAGISNTFIAFITIGLEAVSFQRRVTNNSLTTNDFPVIGVAAERHGFLHWIAPFSCISNNTAASCHHSFCFLLFGGWHRYRALNSIKRRLASTWAIVNKTCRPAVRTYFKAPWCNLLNLGTRVRTTRKFKRKIHGPILFRRQWGKLTYQSEKLM